VGATLDHADRLQPPPLRLFRRIVQAETGGGASGTTRSTPRGVSPQNLHPNVPEKWGDRWLRNLLTSQRALSYRTSEMGICWPAKPAGVADFIRETKCSSAELQRHGLPTAAELRR
jgi:hypothetical protein